MKLKIYLIVAIVLFRFVFAGAQTLSYQDRDGYYYIGGDGSVNLQTTGGQFKNFNNIVPGRNSTSATSVELQGGKSSRAEVFYSEAPMYFGLANSDPAEGVCYIQGSAFMNVQNGAKINQQGVTELTGDFILVEDRLDESSTASPSALVDSKYLFVFDAEGNNVVTSATAGKFASTAAASYNAGTIRFAGLWNVQRIEREDSTGTPILFNVGANDPLKFRTIANFPTIEIRKDSGFGNLTGISTASANDYDAQYLSDGSTKAVDTYVYDPYRMGYLSVATNVAMSVQKLDVTGGQRFSVDAISSALESKAIAKAASLSGLAIPTKMDYYKINYGFVDVANVMGDGYNEMNMRLYDYDPTKEFPLANLANMDTYFTGTSTVDNVYMDEAKVGTTYIATFLRGFTSPFQNLRTDYQFYHLLTKPDNNGYMTDINGPIVDPELAMTPGAAYFFAMDASKYQYDLITEKWEQGSEGWTARNRGGYNFSRFLRQYQYVEKGDSYYGLGFAGLGDKYNLFSANLIDPNNGVERFKTGNVEVMVYGSEGGRITLLANPYLAPISLAGILWNADDLSSVGNSTAEASDTPYNVKINGVVVPGLKAVHAYSSTALATANASNSLLIRSRYNVVSSALTIAKNDKYFFNVKYDAADLGTSATTVADPLNRYLNPLQVFSVQAANTGNFTFTPDMKVNGAWMKPFKTVYGDYLTAPIEALSASNVTRSGRDLVSEEEKFTLPDWFIIEAVSDKGDYTADRTAVRFFDNATQTYDSQRDIAKNIVMINETDEIQPTDRNAMLLRSTQTSLKAANTVYTASLDGTPLLSNNVDYATTKEIPLYYIPSEEEENVTFSFIGLDGFDRLENCWLVDRYNDVRVKLTEGTQYPFLSKANTDEANRFLLVFDDEDEKTSPSNVTPITIYYSGSTLYITGLTEDDLGSVVQIFDLQGRLMGTTKVSNYPMMEYFKPLGLGTFVVKITGKRNFNSKFANTENY